MDMVKGSVARMEKSDGQEAGKVCLCVCGGGGRGGVGGGRVWQGRGERDTGNPNQFHQYHNLPSGGYHEKSSRPPSPLHPPPPRPYFGVVHRAREEWHFHCDSPNNWLGTARKQAAPRQNQWLSGGLQTMPLCLREIRDSCKAIRRNQAARFGGAKLNLLSLSNAETGHLFRAQISSSPVC